MDEPTRWTVNRPSVISDEQGGETVVIDLSSGHYFRLEPASSLLWARLVSPATAAELEAECENPAELAADLPRIVDELAGLGLIRPANETDPAGESLGPWRFDGFAVERFTDLEDILGLDPIHEADPGRGWPHVAGA